MLLLFLYLANTMHAASCQRSCLMTSYMPPRVQVCRGGVVPTLQQLYDGPFAILRYGTHSFTIRVGTRKDVITVNCCPYYSSTICPFLSELPTRRTWSVAAT